MNESILASKLRYSGMQNTLGAAIQAEMYRPTEAELKERAERQVKEVKREEACTVIALAEKLFVTRDVTPDDAFKLAQEMADKAGAFFESRL